MIIRYCPAVLSALCIVVVVSGNDDGQCTMETKETCSDDQSAGKTSEEKEQGTITIPASEDTDTCRKDSCADNIEEGKDVIQNISGDLIPEKDGKSSGETEENSKTKGIEI